MDTSAPRADAPPRNLTWMEETGWRARRSLQAGAVYFLALVGAGWLFGPVRESLVRRGLDPLVAMLGEAPAMLFVMVFASAWAVRRFRVMASSSDRLLVGGFAVLLVVIAEFVGGALVRGWGFYETLSHMTTAPGAVFGALLVAAVLAPLFRRPRRGRSRPARG